MIFSPYVDLLHADEVPTRVGVETLDRLRFRDFLAEVYRQDLPENDDALAQLLENMNLSCAGRLNLAGLLLFGRQPQRTKPAFAVKAVSYPGTVIDVEQYLDSEDFEGPLSKVCEGAMGFVMRSLPKQQLGRGINEPGQLPVPRIVFEELLVNALMHRDYFIEAPVRLFVFQDRVEIISPGNLPNHLTVEKIPGRQLGAPQPDSRFMHGQGDSAIPRSGHGHSSGPYGVECYRLH